ncbi:3-deoxy-manno-octulosonate cytidylyltransferase [Rhizobium leguminosarum bv. viciae]|jgi:3-deoxy-manno-octulosonate cytidylyltransferase (CMP-KDO synthetase)|uniref:3-deoxy-manno-octulosonate cytidylyltransferase n=1 Tax=Rhizobium leguminosarum bv. viciae TaxID=387 RepID=A0A4R0BX32_RHILV|nr:3-deoxy-manno-octulosonate cytidylyltransferase [Rhizobium leguminosarum]MBY5749438.1 3-deoxy-manno-octulosonate cytidylyltransferase [Rhizobium leguminosarum]MBY5776630.1 3-deoxy-manno-octulosonate cytidylyltransferase [Rhizobium leguminosarum]MBY5793283.1 3-deoxy-manno-octulosonate cytidylyltransferase [Rhizobium leguminosarum]MBY5826657.1 3-deoxy-manno-octulosonate cytidylyltransferase [Rhizobium leguminosarum]NKM44915.1 3-deoxy-manno-octulosonate cytidylyltransferase [Rhizobium legumino
MSDSNLDGVLVLIPARMASTRLPGKPLADICGLPMIVQVALRAREAAIGRVVVAVDDTRVFDAVAAAGFEVVMTRADHQSGSDRIFEALTKVDPDGKAKIIVNVQGDLPTIDPETVRAALRPLENEAVDIGTLTTEIDNEEDKTAPHIVKIVGSPISANRLQALYFTRATAPYGQGPLYHHIGLYAYRRAALERFVSLGPSTLEKRESLEQLRALEAGMRIDAEIVDTVPLGVDTPADLEKARRILSAKSN